MFLSHRDVPKESGDPSQSETPREAQPKTALQRWRRRGVTAMEYMVMLSFLILVVVLAVQHIGNLTGGSLSNSAQKTNFLKGK